MAQKITANMIFTRALKLAQETAQAHVHEGHINNTGDQVEAYQALLGGTPGESWCAFFVCFMLVKAYAQLASLPTDRDNLHKLVPTVERILQIQLSGSCDELADSARDHYMLRSKEYIPVPGDLVLYDFKIQGIPHHVGIVSAFIRKHIHDVEGNTGNANPADGDGVYEKVRDTNRVFGYIHPA